MASDQSEKTKIGVRIDPNVYEEFKNSVEDTHGRLNGVLGAELERAMVEYMTGNSEGKLTRIESDVSRLTAVTEDVVTLLQNELGETDEATADGGATTRSEPDSTHTHRTDETRVEPNTSPDPDPVEADPDDPPHAKASRDEKAEWVIGQLDLDRDDPQTGVGEVSHRIENAWSFGPKPRGALIEAVFDRLKASGLVHHPHTDQILVSPERRDSIKANEDEGLAADADDTLDVLDDAAD